MWTEHVQLVASATTSFSDSIRPSSGGIQNYTNGKNFLHHTVMCLPPPQKSMSFNEPISIKLTVTQQIVINMFCTGFYLERRENLEKYFTPWTTVWLPLLRFWLIWYLHSGIMWRFSVPVHTNPSRNMEGAGRNSLTALSKIQLTLSGFSRNTHLLDTLLVQNWSTEFHENWTNRLVSDSEWQMDILTDGFGLHIIFRWYIRIVLLNSNIGIWIARYRVWQSWIDSYY